MLELKFTGLCPECQLKGVSTKMLSTDAIGFYECPIDHFCILTDTETANLGKVRGIGNYNPKTDLKVDFNLEFFANNNKISSKEELAHYILTEVNMYYDFSLENLVKTFISKNKEYKRQSKFFEIDFNDSSIIDKLKKRDLKKGNDRYSSYVLTFELLQKLFEKYKENNISWLPEMGMGPYQVKLCKKHIRNKDIKLLEQNDVLRKQRLMTFMIDLVEIIYFDK